MSLYLESTNFTIQLRDGREWVAINEDEGYDLKGIVATTKDINLLDAVSNGINKLRDELGDLETCVDKRRAELRGDVKA